jgi:crotonobetainyl-CoA:carnitine CoA-transferase CaiB-like acyl-CoA transferase
MLVLLVAGYGQTGPMSHRAGYDAIASAMSGLMHITGPEVGILRLFLFISHIFHNLSHQVKLELILERNQGKRMTF